MKSQNQSTDKYSLSNLTNENLQQYVTQDGSEYIINTINGDASLSVSAASRVLKTARSTIKSALTRLKIETVSAKIVTTTGLRTVAMINSADLYELAKEFQPILANLMLKAGANVYIYGLAGYKISISESTPFDPTTLTRRQLLMLAHESELLLIAAEEREAVLIAQIEQDKPATTLGKLIDKATNNISMGEYAKAIGTGRQRLFDQLREQKILMPLPLNTPYQNMIERGYFVVTEKVTDRGQTFAVTLITAKGQTYLAKKRQEYLNRELAIVSVEKVVELA